MTIPASSIVNVVPGVVTAGGNGLVLNGLFLTENLQMPAGQVLSFTSSAAVSSFFGPASAEYAQSLIYFAGYNNSTAKPTAMLFAPFSNAARSAYVQSAQLALTLTQLQAITPGTMSIDIDGVNETSASINLSGAASFTAAAGLIQAGFSGTVPVVTWNAVTQRFQIASSTTGPSSVLTISTGALATALSLTAATGAISSPGVAIDTPAGAMITAVGLSQNWISMTPLFEPTLTQKNAFAAWFTAMNNEYAYLAWDSDAQASVQGATEPFGVVAIAAKYNGVMCIGGDPAAVPVGTTLAAMALNVATFIAGAIASINFNQTNGRVTLAFLAQSGLLPTCANQQTAANLVANGYSFYGAFATRNQGFVFFYNSNMPGEFQWMDTFVDQVWMSDQFQVALMTLLTSAGSVGYDAIGYGEVRATLQAPIDAAINFGAIRTGVALSAAQISEVNLAAGQKVDQIISTQGWYLQVKDPGATARQNRTSPIVNFWYTDGGAIQNITLAAIDIL